MTTQHAFAPAGRPRRRALVLALAGLAVGLAGFVAVYETRSLWHCHRGDCVFPDMGIRFQLPQGWVMSCTANPPVDARGFEAAASVRTRLPGSGGLDEQAIVVTLYDSHGLSLEEWNRKRIEGERPRMAILRARRPWNPVVRPFGATIDGEASVTTQEEEEGGRVTSLSEISVKHGQAIYTLLPYNQTARDFAPVFRAFLESIRFAGSPDFQPHKACL